jgi:hypothetical protein
LLRVGASEWEWALGSIAAPANEHPGLPLSPRQPPRNQVNNHPPTQTPTRRVHSNARSPSPLARLPESFARLQSAPAVTGSRELHSLGPTGCWLLAAGCQKASSYHPTQTSSCRGAGSGLQLIRSKPSHAVLCHVVTSASQDVGPKTPHPPVSNSKLAPGQAIRTPLSRLQLSQITLVGCHT